MLDSVKKFFMKPYEWYVRRRKRKMLEKRMEELKQQDPFTYD